VEGLRGWWRLLRVQRPVTRVLGPRYQRSRDRIELDITWACNLRCFNCNRSCEQAPTGEGMSLHDVDAFVAETVAAGKRWSRIRVLGGEPTLHPDFLAILDRLRAWRAEHAPDAVIEVVSNGHGEKVLAALARIPPDVRVENTAKLGPDQPFQTFNVAPIDLPAYQNADFVNGCAVTSTCGIGRTAGGYYPCAVAGGIDRIVGLEMGRPTLPSDDDDMFDQLDAFCRRCGSFKRLVEEPVSVPVQSETWTEAYAAYDERRRTARASRRSREGDDDVRA
jgi:sulfatase maturation enzyme AslB (radical SAM superfamily)